MRDALGGQPGIDLSEGLPIVFGFSVFATLGALVLAKRPRNALGWIMAGSPALLMLDAVADRRRRGPPPHPAGARAPRLTPP